MRVVAVGVGVCRCGGCLAAGPIAAEAREVDVTLGRWWWRGCGVVCRSAGGEVQTGRLERHWGGGDGLLARDARGVEEGSGRLGAWQRCC